MEDKPKTRKVITKKLSNESEAVESVKKSSNETSVSVFTRSTNPRVVVGAEKVDDERLYCNKRCSGRILKFVFMVVMSILLIITFFVSLRTYHIVENLSANGISSLN